MRSVIMVGIILIAGCSSPPPPSAPVASEVTLNVVKLPELEKVIASHQGKVVVLDMWAEYWLPCKKEFPHLVEMHKKYSTNGLVCISVSIDDVDEMKSTLAFLKQMNSTLANYLLDEPGELREAKLDVGPPPTVLVFDKNGKRVKKFSTEEPFTYEDVEKLAVSLLK